MIRPGPMLRAGLWGSVGLAVVGCSRFEAQPEPARFEILGAHAALTCEACHTEGQPYQPLSTDCRSCHEADRPSPTHFAEQTCNDAGCHSSAHLLWTDVIAPGGDFHDFLPLEDAHDLDCAACHTDTENYADLPGVSAWCWNCHEEDRKPDDDTPNGLHYIQYLVDDPKTPDPRFRWDCGPCHEPVDWSTNIDHPWRSPHGTLIEGEKIECEPVPENEWVSGCIGCHPTSTATADCLGCHTDAHFTQANAVGCTEGDCHASAQPLGCDSLSTPAP